MQPYSAPTPPPPESPAPSATRRRIGALGVLWHVIVNPRHFFEGLSTLDVRIADILFYALLTGLEWASLVVVEFGRRLDNVLVPAAITFALGAATSVLQLYVTAGLVHLVARWLGGQASFTTTRRAMAYGSAPSLFIAVPYAGWVAALWALVVQILAIAIVHEFSRLRAVAAYASQFVVFIGLALGLRIFALEAYSTPSSSMYPTLLAGDHVFVAKASYGWFQPSPPGRSDVVVFAYPDPDPANQRMDFIKRAIGVPGDVIEVVHGQPIINGWSVPRCRVGEIAIPSVRLGAVDRGDPGELFVEFLAGAAYLVVIQPSRDEFDQPRGPFTVPPGEFYVLGDNRSNSMDSRRFNSGLGGGVPFKDLKGRAGWIWFPLARAGISLDGKPGLPGPSDKELSAALARCLEHPPSAARSTPPAPPAPAPSPDRP